MTIRKIISVIQAYPCLEICITGGEPLMQRETLALIDHLLTKEYRVCLETNGSYSIQRLVGKKSLIISLDIKCPSSGAADQMDFENISALSKKDQLKFIIKDKKDYEYAKKIVQAYAPTCPVFFQPVWGTDPKRLVSWILRDRLAVRLSMQLHKVIWGSKRGV